MERVRIAILDPNDSVQGFIDNGIGSAKNYYYNDELHEYLQGAAGTFILRFSGCRYFEADRGRQ